MRSTRALFEVSKRMTARFFIPKSIPDAEIKSCIDKLDEGIAKNVSLNSLYQQKERTNDVIASHINAIPQSDSQLIKYWANILNIDIGDKPLHHIKSDFLEKIKQPTEINVELQIEKTDSASKIRQGH